MLVNYPQSFPDKKDLFIRKKCSQVNDASEVAEAWDNSIQAVAIKSSAEVQEAS